MIHFLQAIVFDFDGVITDSEPLHLRAMQEVLEPQGLRLDGDEYYARYLGFDDDGVFRAIARDRGVRLDDRAIAMLIARKTERYQELGCAAPVLFDGVVEKVREWSAEVPLAIASGALRTEIELILNGVGLRSYFRAIVGADDTPRSKPSPDPYQRAVQLLDEANNGAETSRPLDPRRCVAIEDSEWGIQSARVAGLRTVGITNSYQAKALTGADLIISSLRDLTLEALDELSR